MAKRSQYLNQYPEPMDPVSNTEGGTLAMFWRKILNESGLSKKLAVLFRNYEIKANKNKGKFKSKSTIIQNATSSEMTFKVFLDLLINLLNVKKIRLNIELTFFNDTVTSHSIDISPNVVDNTTDADIDVMEEIAKYQNRYNKETTNDNKQNQ